MQSCHVHSNTCSPSLLFTCSCRTCTVGLRDVFLCWFLLLEHPLPCDDCGRMDLRLPVCCSTSIPTLIAIHNINSRCLILPTYYARPRLQIACTCSDKTCRERNHTFVFRVRGSSHVLFLGTLGDSWVDAVGAALIPLAYWWCIWARQHKE